MTQTLTRTVAFGCLGFMACGLAAAFEPPASPARPSGPTAAEGPDSQKASSQVLELSYRSYRKWNIQLPNELWFPVQDGIRLDISTTTFAVEADGGSLRVDTDGDGQLDRSIKPLVDPKTNVSTTRVILEGQDKSGVSFRYAARLRNDANGWEWAPGGALAGTIKTDTGLFPIRLIDRNGNGRHDDIGSDAMIVGSSKQATLLSSTIYLGDQLASIDYQRAGQGIAFSPYAGETAKVDMTTAFTSKAVLLSSIIVSRDRQHSFDVAAFAGPVEIPAGTYQLASGVVGLGKQRVFIAAGRCEPIELTAGKTKQLAWGGPVKSEFRYQRNGDQVQFAAEGISFFGKAGETYVGWNPIGKSPTFTISDADTGAVLEVAILPGKC